MKVLIKIKSILALTSTLFRKGEWNSIQWAEGESVLHVGPDKLTVQNAVRNNVTLENL